MDKEIKVVYDGYFFNKEIIGGISRYWFEVWNRLIKIQEFKPILLSIPNENKTFTYFNNSGNNFKIYPHLFQKNWHALNHPFLRSIKLNLDFLKHRIGNDYIFHSTLYSTPFPKFRRPAVVTIHDLNIFTMPERYKFHRGEKYFKKDIASSIDRADIIIAVSNTTKNNILKFFSKVDESKIKVIYHGINSIFFSDKSNNTDTFAFPFFLFVGGRNMYKNLDVILDALLIVREKKPDIKLVLVGDTSADHKLSEKKKIIGMGLEKHVIDLGVVSDYELKNLYSKALSFIFPSHGEGFGFPLLEALACGCNVIASDIEIFHELGGSYVRYFSPDNSKYLADLLIDSTLEPMYTLRESRINYARSFTWEQSADNLLSLYSSF